VERTLGGVRLGGRGVGVGEGKALAWCAGGMGKAFVTGGVESGESRRHEKKD